jgi:hypothetical protein
MKRLYETKISNARWIAYDLPGNIGWIAYIVALTLCFAKSPEFMSNGVLRGLTVAAIIPALMMLVGIAELIHERICKQDRILPGWQLFLGFGSLTLGGIVGSVLSLSGVVYGIVQGVTVTLLCIMSAGGVLCATFAGLIYMGFRPKEDL